MLYKVYVVICVVYYIGIEIVLESETLMVIRTFGKLHFTDLDPTRFEMLSMDMIYRMRNWENLVHHGAAGSDNGVDIQAVEVLENGKKVTHHFQCKRYEKISPSILKSIVNDYIQKNGGLRPDYYYIICGCDVSKKAYDTLIKYCKEKSFHEVIIWTASFLESKLYAEYHDLLFAFFGVNLSAEKTNRVQAIRRNVALKKRMQKDFFKPAAPGERRKHQSETFNCDEVVIRSIYDIYYPNISESGYGWFKTEVYGWYHNGLMVRVAPYGVEAKVRMLKSTAKPGSDNPDDFETAGEVLETVGCIPFDKIIEYDLEGDEFYRCPHIYCDFERDPYEEIRYCRKDGYPIDPAQIVDGRME